MTEQEGVGVISLAPGAIGRMVLEAESIRLLWCRGEVLGGNENIYKDEGLGQANLPFSPSEDFILWQFHLTLEVLKSTIPCII